MWTLYSGGGGGGGGAGQVCSYKMYFLHTHIVNEFNTEGLVLSIKSSKTDQFREDAFLVVVRIGASTCLVEMMERNFRMGHLNVVSNERVLIAIVNT